MSPRGLRDSAPLSFAQQRLWFLDCLEPGNPIYNVPAAIRLEGPLDPALLERCFREVIRRHEILRTNFLTEAGQPLLRVAAERDWSLAVADLSALARTDQETEVERQAVAAAGERFAAHDSLLRAKLLRLDPERHVLLLTMHHIVCDGWSMGVLRRELRELYEAFSAGRPSPLPELPGQYSDYAVWQREWLRGGSARDPTCLLAEAAGRRSSGAGTTHGPTAASRADLRGKDSARRLPVGVVEGLQALARQQRATLFMVLLAGWQTLLARCSGQDDICVGTPVASRRVPELEPLIGFFVNTLVLRTDLSGDPRFGNWSIGCEK